MWEEPCISGKNGSGTVFFTSCQLSCKFCQNYKISQNKVGKVVSIEELANIFVKLQNMGANNINLVSPTIYVYQIKEAIIIAKKLGVKIPFIYNSSGYENVEVIKKLNGLIDVYLPDFKYATDILAKKYSNADRYVENVEKSLLEMKKQVSKNEFDKDGMIQRGIIIRHLILPNNLINSKLVIKWIKDNLGSDTYVSVMSQYFPTYKAKYDDKINRKIMKEELESINNYIDKIGIFNGYIQNLENCEEKYVPKF